MKTISNRIKQCLLFFAAFVVVESASAFYDAGLGRWINRDPIGEPGFEELNLGGVDPLGDGPNLYAFVANNPITRVDSFGLDSPGCDGVPGKLESPCRLECCAQHDKCYHDNKCKASSWCLESASMACRKCNKDALKCMAKCLGSKKDDPKKPNYYCGVHDVLFSDSTSPHMGHSTP